MVNASSGMLVKRLWSQYLQQHLGKISISVLCMIIVALGAGVQARLIEPALDKVLVSGDIQMGWLLPIVFFLTSVIRGLGSYGQTVLMHKVGLRIIATLQSQMFSRVVTADVIYVLDKGKIVEQGDHQTLIKQNGLYKRLCELQFGNDAHQIQNATPANV